MKDSLGIVGEFRSVDVLLVGDFMVDVWLDGPCNRLSPEAPCPVIDNPSRLRTAGGAGNTAINITSLGAECHAVGASGSDADGEILNELLSNAGVNPCIVPVGNRLTTVKMRVMSGSHHFARLDWETRADVADGAEEALIQEVHRCLDEYDINVVIVSDYAKGVITERVMKEIVIAAGRQTVERVPVIVDPKAPNWSRYVAVKDCTIDVIKPNLKNLEAILDTKIVTEAEILAAGREAMKQSGARSLVLTRGPHGMTVFSEYATFEHIPAHLAEVFEVSGAGDTANAVLGICRGAGMEVFQSAKIANVAASLVVRKTGTASVSPTELAAALREVGLNGEKDTQDGQQKEGKG